jgi:hypothetical protein
MISKNDLKKLIMVKQIKPKLGISFIINRLNKLELIEIILISYYIICIGIPIMFGIFYLICL